jgi:hypothetical protein
MGVNHGGQVLKCEFSEKFIIQDPPPWKASERAIRVILLGDMSRVAFCAARER